MLSPEQHAALVNWIDNVLLIVVPVIATSWWRSVRHRRLVRVATGLTGRQLREMQQKLADLGREIEQQKPKTRPRRVAEGVLAKSLSHAKLPFDAVLVVVPVGRGARGGARRCASNKGIVGTSYRQNNTEVTNAPPVNQKVDTPTGAVTDANGEPVRNVGRCRGARGVDLQHRHRAPGHRVLQQQRIAGDVQQRAHAQRVLQVPRADAEQLERVGPFGRGGQGEIRAGRLGRDR